MPSVAAVRFQSHIRAEVIFQWLGILNYSQVRYSKVRSECTWISAVSMVSKVKQAGGDIKMGKCTCVCKI